jgi:hypothetical protein
MSDIAIVSVVGLIVLAVSAITAIVFGRGFRANLHGSDLDLKISPEKPQRER